MMALSRSFRTFLLEALEICRASRDAEATVEHGTLQSLDKTVSVLKADLVV